MEKWPGEQSFYIHVHGIEKKKKKFIIKWVAIHTRLSLAAGHYESKYIVAKVIFLHNMLEAFSRSGLSHTSFQRTIWEAASKVALACGGKTFLWAAFQCYQSFALRLTDRYVYSRFCSRSYNEPLPPRLTPDERMARNPKTVSLMADAKFIAHHERHSGSATEGDGNRRNTSNSRTEIFRICRIQALSASARWRRAVQTLCTKIAIIHKRLIAKRNTALSICK